MDNNVLRITTPYAAFGLLTYLVSNKFWLVVHTRLWLLVKTTVFAVSNTINGCNHILSMRFKCFFIKANSLEKVADADY